MGQAEHDGAQLQTWLDALFGEAGDSLLLLDAMSGRVLCANGAVVSLLGRSLPELAQRDWRELVLAKHHGRFAALLAAPTARSAEILLVEFMHNSGRNVQAGVRTFAVPKFHAIGIMLRESTDCPLGFDQSCGVARELRHRSEELASLDALEREIRSSLAVDDVIAAAIREMQRATTADLVFLFLREGQQLVLRAMEPEAGRTRMGVVPEHRVGECLCGLAAQHGKPVYSKQIHEDKSCSWEECKRAGFVSFAALPLIARAELIGVMGLASLTQRDFSEQAKFLETMAGEVAANVHNAQLYGEVQRAASAADEARQFADATLASLPGVFYVITQEGRFVRWNKNFERVTGYDANDMTRLHPLDLFRGADRDLIAGRIAQVFSEGSADAEAQFVSKSGRSAPYYFTGTRIMHGGQPCLIGIGVDVTERRDLSERLLHHEKLAAIGRLAGGVAHDFNNQLTAIMGCAELLVGGTVGSPQQKHAQSILASAARAAELTRQLLSFARKREQVSIRVDINALVREVTSLLKRSLDKRIEIKTDLRASLPMVAGDPALLQNAILNLAVNSRDAMPQGGLLTIITEDVARVPQAGENCRQAPAGFGALRLTVQDTGHGMSEEVRNRLFEPFFTTKANGTGMGLASVYGTVRSHGGHISVESAVGQGTRTYVCLPVCESGATAPARVEAAPGTQVTTARLLLVDDEDAVREMAHEALQGHGYAVTSFSSGAEAVEFFRTHGQAFDLVVLDLMMPGMSGIETFNAMRAIKPDVRALLTSGYGPEGAVDEALKAGMQSYLSKPYLVANLVKKIQPLLPAAQP